MPKKKIDFPVMDEMDAQTDQLLKEVQHASIEDPEIVQIMHDLLQTLQDIHPKFHLRTHFKTMIKQAIAEAQSIGNPRFGKPQSSLKLKIQAQQWVTQVLQPFVTLESNSDSQPIAIDSRCYNAISSLGFSKALINEDFNPCRMNLICSFGLEITCTYSLFPNNEIIPESLKFYRS